MIDVAYGEHIIADMCLLAVRFRTQQQQPSLLIEQRFDESRCGKPNRSELLKTLVGHGG